MKLIVIMSILLIAMISLAQGNYNRNPHDPDSVYNPSGNQYTPGNVGQPYGTGTTIRPINPNITPTTPNSIDGDPNEIDKERNELEQTPKEFDRPAVPSLYPGSYYPPDSTNMPSNPATPRNN